MNAARLIPTVLVLTLVLSCGSVGTAPEMSLDEARDVVLRMQSVPLEPPPRQMDDILAVLERHRRASTDALDALIDRANRPAPEIQNPADLYQFYKSRAYARYYLNRFQECREDIRKAIAYDAKAQIGDGTLQHQLAELEMRAGRYESALELSRDAIRVYKVGGWRMGPYLAFQSRVHHRMGNFFRADMAIRNAKALFRQVPSSARLSLIIDGGVIDIGNQNDLLAAEAEMLEAGGDYVQAHALRAMVLNYHYSKRHQKPLASVHAQIDMAANLMHQGRLVLAEKQARTAVLEAVQAVGRQSAAAADALQILGRIMLAKGDLPNADRLAEAQVDILSRLGLSVDEDIMVRARLFDADVRFADGDFTAAMASYDLALTGMAGNPYFFKRYACRNPALIVCLIKSGRIAEAEDLIRQTGGAIGNLGVPDAGEAAQIRALEAMVLYGKRRFGAALEHFSAAVPGLVAVIQAPESTFEKRRRAQILLQAYIDMLLDEYEKAGRQAHGVDVVEELFKLVDARHSRVGNALGESSARAASFTDPELAELVRQEQDAAKRIKSLQSVFYNACAAEGSGNANPTLERSIQSLVRARAAIAARIEKRFPKYAQYIYPIAPGMARVQARLAPGEAFVAIWTMTDKTCVWAIPREGEAAFAAVDLGEPEVCRMVGALRKALKPDARWLSEVPEFDTATAYEIYRRILAPVAGAWRGATDLLVVIRGPLDQIPLAVLPTAPVMLAPHADIRFDAYRSVPFLIRSASVTRLPSPAALLTLRALPGGRRDREVFAGFGDPVFSAAAVGASASDDARLAKGGGREAQIAIRGLRITKLGQLDNRKIASVRLENLCGLPDTADELKNIAASLQADPATDVFLGREASENRVKTLNLTKKRILAFATHALLPGDLDGLTQPALAFSSPHVTEMDEDGLLTAAEILTLTLDADLVVLSACDTGAGDGIGNEAVSGLGRAFFYAGARALLVTMWPVETTAASRLMTGLFHCRNTDSGLSWARAHQRSICQIMDAPGLRNDQGIVVASYAHPLFWGPFVVVGDSGAR